MPVAVLVLAALAGCGGSDDTSTSSSAPPPVTTTAPSSAASTPSAAPSTSSSSASTGNAVRQEQAKTIALKATGGGTVTKVESDDEDNRQVWKVKVATSGSQKRKVSVDKSTGQVVKNEVDNDSSDGNDTDNS